MINRIWTRRWGKYSANNNGLPQYLELKRMNIFVGRNNSGKSLLIRELLKSNDDDVSYSLLGDKYDQFNDEVKMLWKVIPPESGVNTISSNLLDLYLNFGNILSIKNRNGIHQSTTEIESIRGGRISTTTGNVNTQVVKNLLTSFLNENQRGLLSKSIEKPIKVIFRYVPILRGMRPLTDDRIEYSRRTMKDYFSEFSNISLSIHTGEDLYRVLTEHLLGLPEQRQKVAEYERLLSERFFECKAVTLIPRHDHDVVNIKIGDDMQRPIYEVGDGLQQIIIITYTAFFAPETCLIMLEEPETGMHPGLLRQLMNFLLDCTQHQFFITTHSNHILELADERHDVIRHKIRKISDGDKSTFEINTIDKEREILIDLGVKASSVYLANCTIWVEGITDRLYLKSFFKKYLIELKVTDNEKYEIYKKYFENYHYAFVEYQGGNLAHWSFSEDDNSLNELSAISVASPAFLIADGDIQNKGERVIKLKEQLKNDFHLLHGKEIENVIPETIVIETVKEMFKNFKRNTYLKDINQVDKLKYEKYVSSPDGLGYHIDKAIGLTGKGQKANKVFAGNSGTIKDKTQFCLISTRRMDDLNWELTNEIRDICDKVFLHISKNN